ncbi:MAG: DinB family protein [Nocardioides sp.]
MSEQPTRQFPDMWVDPDDDPRDTGTTPHGEKAVLAEYLDHFRMTFEMKCEGLDAEQLARRSVPPSTMSLLGLVRHLASVEFHWFRRFIEGDMDQPRPFKSPDDRDLDFNGAVADPEVVAEAWEVWRGEVAHAREVYERYDDLGTLVGPEGDQSELREIVVHMIEEYARHCGHADLLRECVDGRTGQ